MALTAAQGQLANACHAGGLQRLDVFGVVERSAGLWSCGLVDDRPSGTYQPLDRKTLYHYTNEDGLRGIRDSGELWASTKANNPRDARYGDGQYLSDFEAGTLRRGQLSARFLKIPWSGRRFTHYVEIDVSGLHIIRGRDNVYLIRNDGALDITGRIVRWGEN
jgi:hypothetical protein